MKIRLIRDFRQLEYNFVKDYSSLVLPDETLTDNIYVAFAQRKDGISCFLLENSPLPAGFMNGKIFLSGEKIEELFSTNNDLRELLAELVSVGETPEFDRETKALFLYFFLSGDSVSVGLMANWFEETGMNNLFSEKISLELYMFKAEHSKSSLISDLSVEFFQMPETEILYPGLFQAQSVDEFFSTDFTHKPIRLVYDNYFQFSGAELNGHGFIFNCHRIPETAYLIKDHHNLILGFSNNLAEVMTLCLDSCNEFYEFLRSNSQLAERTYKSLIGFLCEKKTEFNEYITFSGLAFTLGVIGKDLKINYLTPQNLITFCHPSILDRSILPLFLRIGFE